MAEDVRELWQGALKEIFIVDSEFAPNKIVNSIFCSHYEKECLLIIKHSPLKQKIKNDNKLPTLEKINVIGGTNPLRLSLLNKDDQLYSYSQRVKFVMKAFWRGICILKKR